MLATIRDAIRSAIFAALLLLAPGAGPALAGLMITAPGVAVPLGGEGSFDILLANTNFPGGASYNVFSVSLDVSLINITGVEFLDVSINTVDAPYIFVDPGVNNGGGPLANGPFPGTHFTTADTEFDLSPGYRVVAPGDVYGLARVSFRVNSNAPVGGTGVIVFNLDGTSVADENGLPVSGSLAFGSITVLAPIPEPSSLALSAAALLALGAGALARRRRC